MHLLEPSRMAILHARRFLGGHILANQCHDTWAASKGEPPTKHSHSVFLMYFAARALHVSGGVEPATRDRILGCLEMARKGPAYAYDRLSPPDADDTAFALRTRLLLQGQVPVAEVVRALEPFAFRNSWLTFCGPIRPGPGWTVQYHDDASIFGMHPEVHLNVSLLLQESRAGGPAYPADMPVRDGLVLGYHYPSALYTTWLASELQTATGGSPSTDASILALQEGSGSWPETEHGFSRSQETSIALLTLTRLAAEGVGRGLRYLLAEQQPDGSWPGGVLWTYHVPRTGGRMRWWAEDSQRMVSTSLALLAIQRCISGTRAAEGPS